LNLPGQLHHVGVAVRELATGLERTKESHGVVRHSVVFEDPLQRVAVQFCELAGGVHVELVAPRGDDSPVRGVLARGGGLYHTAHAVDELDAVARWAREHRGLPLTEPLPAVSFDGNRILFVQFAGLWLVEFVERCPIERVYEHA
jgi:methylmalonyl-CoA/ethylmalonyl-CoA epimerase